VTSRFSSFAVARSSVPHVSATTVAVRLPSLSASNRPSFVAVVMARAWTGAYASSIGTGTIPEAMIADSTGFSAHQPDAHRMTSIQPAWKGSNIMSSRITAKPMPPMPAGSTASGPATSPRTS
jgi:hypothetical protein